jgi:O-antigen/teichoic acid export membrane protein
MKRPLSNLLSFLLGDLGSRFIGFFVSIYLARVLQPSGFGLMNLGLAVLGYLQLAGSPGIQMIETRNVAAMGEMDRSRAGAIVTLRLVLGIALWCIAAILSFFLVDDSGTRTVILLFGAIVLPFALTLDWAFQGKEHFADAAFARLAQYVVYAAIVFVAVKSPSDVSWSAIAFGVGSVVSVIILWARYAKRWGSLRLNFSFALWRSILRSGVPVGVAMFLAQSVSNLPPLVIGYFSTQSDVGLFSAAMKVIFVALIFDRIFNALFLPVATRHFGQSSSADLNRLLQTTLRATLAVVLPCAIAGVLLRDDAIRLLFGGGYENAGTVLAVLMAYFPLTLVNSFFTAVLVSSGREGEYTRMTAYGSVALCGAVIAGTILSGVVGAAAGVVLGEATTVILMGSAARTSFHFSLIDNLWRPAVATVIAVGCAIGCQGMDSYIASIIMVIVFAISLLLVRGITTDEVQFLRERFV